VHADNKFNQFDRNLAMTIAGVQLPLVAIPIGDPCGIGPEIAAKVSLDQEVAKQADILLIGDRRIVHDALDLIKADDKIHTVTSGSIELAPRGGGRINVLDVLGIGPGEFSPGIVDARAGKASLDCIRVATNLALAGEIHAFVTAPVNKEALHKGGMAFSADADFMADLCGTPRIAAMVVSDNLRVFQVTSHVSLRKAIDLITIDRIVETINLANRFFLDHYDKPPKLAVAALNPHAGEGGTMGTEEIDIVIPAVEIARSTGINVDGPIPADVIFWKARKGDYNAVISLYHDQANIPIKLLDPYGLVVVTVGLPVIRTSVAHGTAFDIAWKGIADHSALRGAVLAAAELARARQKNQIE
jgi:4-hydroxythreonine-4-phosphate dehydrogenase